MIQFILQIFQFIFARHKSKKIEMTYRSNSRNWVQTEDYDLELDLINSFKNLKIIDLPKFAPKDPKKCTPIANRIKTHKVTARTMNFDEDGNINYDFFTIGLDIDKPLDLQNLDFLTPPPKQELIIPKVKKSNQFCGNCYCDDRDESSSSFPKENSEKNSKTSFESDESSSDDDILSHFIHSEINNERINDEKTGQPIFNEEQTQQLFSDDDDEIFPESIEDFYM